MLKGKRRWLAIGFSLLMIGSSFSAPVFALSSVRQVPVLEQAQLPQPIIDAFARLGVTDPNLLAGLSQAIGNPQALGQALAAAGLFPTDVRRELRNLDNASYEALTQYLGVGTPEQMTAFYQTFDAASFSGSLTRTGISQEEFNSLLSMSAEERTAFLTSRNLAPNNFFSLVELYGRTTAGAAAGFDYNAALNIMREGMSEGERLAFWNITPAQLTQMVALDPTSPDFDAQLAALGSTRRDYTNTLRLLEGSNTLASAVEAAGVDPERLTQNVDAVAASNTANERPGADTGAQFTAGELNPDIQVSAPVVVPRTVSPEVIAQLPPQLQAILPLFGPATPDLLQQLPAAIGNTDALLELMAKQGVIGSQIRLALATATPEQRAGLLQLAGISESGVNDFMNRFDQQVTEQRLARYNMTTDDMQTILNASPEERAALLEQFGITAYRFSDIIQKVAGTPFGAELGVTRESSLEFARTSMTPQELGYNLGFTNPAFINGLLQLEPTAPDFLTRLGAFGYTPADYAFMFQAMQGTDVLANAAQAAGVPLEAVEARAAGIQQSIDGAFAATGASETPVGETTTGSSEQPAEQPTEAPAVEQPAEQPTEAPAGEQPAEQPTTEGGGS
jgi:hypothetical protein